MSTRAAELNARGDPGRARRGRPQAQRPAPKDARLPDPAEQLTKLTDGLHTGTTER
jgi:hypothetical protein